MPSILDDDTVRTCAKLCDRSYADPGDPDAWGSFEGEKFFQHDATDTQAYSVRDEDSGTLFIVFRGTSNLSDWATNLQSWMTKSPYGWVHAGFLTAWRGIREVMQKEILHALGPKSRVVVTGHSLGGALATLCSVDLAQTIGVKDIACVTFGSPRVGGRSFRKAFREAGITSGRYAIQADPVIYIPSVFMAYVHVPGKVVLDPNANCLSFTLDVMCSPIDDHKTEQYIKMLEGDANAPQAGV